MGNPISETFSFTKYLSFWEWTLKPAAWPGIEKLHVHVPKIAEPWNKACSVCWSIISKVSSVTHPDFWYAKTIVILHLKRKFKKTISTCNGVFFFHFSKKILGHWIGKKY